MMMVMMVAMTMKMMDDNGKFNEPGHDEDEMAI